MESASSTATETATATVEERKLEEEAAVHKTKLIQFLGRTTPIILQNDNGPCPLLAICNVLSLRNCLNLSPDVPEILQEKLLSLVAERLIDSNSNVNNKDAGYVENQQQNIADAIDLLPRLTTGIDVNIKFRRIDDFEFTPECAIFDLLDIPLYHGWIVDPQDHETANAIGLKSYNMLMSELVALETQNMKSEHRKNSEGDCVDFAAATTAALGVPSPCLSRGRSFDDSPVSMPEHNSPVPIFESHKARKGNLEEAADIMRILELSEAEMVTPSAHDVSTDEANSLLSPKESACRQSSESGALAEASERIIAGKNGKTSEHEASIINDARALSSNNNDEGRSEILSEETVCSSGKPDLENLDIQSASVGSEVLVEKIGFNSQVKDESTLLESKQDLSAASLSYGDTSGADGDQSQPTTTAEAHDVENKQDGTDTIGTSCSMPVADSKLVSGGTRNLVEAEALTSNIDGSEPIYEGEDCILDSKLTTYQNREPIYEGEVVLAKQVDTDSTVSDTNSRCEMDIEQGDLVRDFLKNSASQLTVYGLFCLRDGIKERELCVFFRNNHFNTMFKFEGELYILVTDQGYINQPDLVWEKLNEVNGDTVYMTGNFKEFKVDNHSNSTWDEQNALASTADYLASIDTSAQEHSSFNSDLQLAIALQQQEFEQQQAQRNNNVQQQTTSGPSRLVTGPQVPRNTAKPTSSSSKQDLKTSKEKCTVM